MKQLLARVALLIAVIACPGCSFTDGRVTQSKTDVLQRALLLETLEVGEIDSIRAGRFTGAASNELCIAGDRGAVFAGADGKVSSRIEFDNRAVGVVPLDVDGDGVFEFMGRGGGWSSVSLLDHEGRMLWKFPAAGQSKPTPDQMAAGDLDGDGVAEFVVGTNGSGGVHVLDSEGQTLVVIEGVNVFAVAVLDIDGDGSSEIVHSHGGRGSADIVIRDAGGEVIRNLDLGRSSPSFTILRSPDGTPRLVTKRRSELLLYDFDGRAVGSYELSRRGHDPDALYVQLDATADPYLAVVRTIGATAGVSELHVFDPGGELVHREEFAHSHIAATAKDVGEDGQQSLLVSAGSTVWEYRL